MANAPLSPHGETFLLNGEVEELASFVPVYDQDLDFAFTSLAHEIPGVVFRSAEKAGGLTGALGDIGKIDDASFNLKLDDVSIRVNKARQLRSRGINRDIILVGPDEIDWLGEAYKMLAERKLFEAQHPPAEESIYDGDDNHHKKAVDAARYMIHALHLRPNDEMLVGDARRMVTLLPGLVSIGEVKG